METSDREPHFRDSCLEALQVAIDQYKSIYADDIRGVTKWESRITRDLPRSSRLQLYKCTDEKQASSSTLYKVVLGYVSSTDRIWSLGSWHALFQATGTKKLWDHRIEKIEAIGRPGLNTAIFKQWLQNDGTESSITVEKTNRKHNRIRHVIANLKQTDGVVSSQPESIAYLFYDIETTSTDDLTLDSRVVLYYNDFSRLSAMPTEAEREAYMISLVTGPLSFLGLHGPPPFIRHCQKDFEPRRTDYNPDERSWIMQYQLSRRSDSSSAAIGSIDIESSGQDSIRTMRRWQSASWEHDRSLLQFASPLRHRKNSFMSSPISFTPSSPVNHMSVQRRGSAKMEKIWLPKSNLHKYGERRGSALSRDNVLSSSYTFGDHKATLNTLPDILIEINSETWSENSAIDVSIVLFWKNGNMDESLQAKLQNHFAHLCVRCFEKAAAQRKGEHDYYLSIQHPAQMIQYLMDDISASGPAGSESLLCNGNDNDLYVQLQLMKRPSNEESFCIYVNGKKWPILEEESDPWIASDEDEDVDSEHDSISISSGEGTQNEGADEDIFIGGMDPLESTEPLPEKVVAPKIEPISLKATAPVQTDDTVAKTQSTVAKTPKLTKPVLPETDPPSIQKVHGYTDELLQRQDWQILQKPEPTNNYIAIKKVDVPNSPTGALLSESVWTDCSVWDIKAVISCTGARRVWDNAYEDGTFVHQVSPTCSIWQHKVKGFWLVSPRDYLVFNGVYTSPYQINIYATSCTTDHYDHQPLPKTPQGYIRAQLDLWGWRLQRAGDDKVSVKFLMQANPQGWIPSYIPNNLSGNSPEVLMHVYNFYKKHGAPPDLIRLEHGSLLDISYEHNRRSWRCEYVRATELFTTQDTPNNASTLLEVRLSTRLDLGHTYNIVVDPPPSRVHASSKYFDSKGIWLRIEHDEDAIIPQRSKILVLIKPELDESAELLVNGIMTVIERDTTQPVEEKDENEASPEPTENAVETAKEDDSSKSIKNDSGPVITSLAIDPIDRAQSAFAFLVKMSDQQFGWTSVSDKDDIQVSKRLGSKIAPSKTSEQAQSRPENEGELQVPDSLVIIRASKVIEGFSLEEVASLVTDAGSLRKRFDESVEESEILFQGNNGCHVSRQLIKGIFPFKSREVYICSCTAYETASLTINTSSTRVLYVETLIPDYPGPAGSKYPRADFYFSGWVLERIDPYTTTTNHPIPSMRATLVASVDLGSAVPTYMSNLLTTGLPKRLKSVEAYLRSQGPPPYLAWPVCAQNFGAGIILDDNRHQYPNEDGGIDWINISTVYDPSSCRLEVCNTFQLAPLKPRLSVANVPKPSTSSPQPKTKPFSPSTRRASDSSHRLPLKRSPQIKPIVVASTPRASVTSESISNSRPKDMDEKKLLLRSIIDLRKFANGYEINMHLEGGDDKSQDLSGNLTLQVSELAPEPSHLLVSAGKDRPRKHAIKVFAQGLAFLAPGVCYKISMDIMPLNKDQSKEVTRLTVSGILGEEDEQWHGPVIFNGREIQIDSEVSVAAASTPSPESIASNSHKVTAEDSKKENEYLLSPTAEEPPSTPVGGSMVAAALEGVSASVNQIQDFRTRMLLPFRNASTSFLATKEQAEDDQQSYASLPSSHTDEYHSPSSPPLIRVRQHRSLSDIRRRQEIEIKGLKRRFFVILFILLLIVVLGFIFRLPGLELKEEAAEIRSLWRLPLFPTVWTLQLVVVRV